VRLEDRLKKDKKSPDRELDQESTEIVKQLKMDNLALAQQYESVCQNLMQRKDRIADLLADLSVAQADVEKARQELKQIKKEAPSQHQDIMSIFPESASLKEMLEGVLELEGIQMVLIADDYGLLVESAGKGFPSETLAALSSLVARIGPQIQDFFSMGNVTTVVLGDDEGLVLETSYFELFDVRCALTIARDKSSQYPDLSEQTVSAIIERFKD
jgi:predicted regulator of Ras-like GTPase activity (Roadblock/LC7/MglB family)